MYSCFSARPMMGLLLSLLTLSAAATPLRKDAAHKSFTDAVIIIAQNDPTNSGPALFTVEFDESVTGFTAADIDLTGSTAPGTLSASINALIPGLVFEVSVTGMTGDGIIEAFVVDAAAILVSDGATPTTASTPAQVRYDATMPTLTATSIINNTSDTKFTFRAQVDEDATVFYVVTTSSTPPSSAQIMSGQNESGSAAIADGFAGTAAATNLDQNIIGLSAATAYYVYAVALDGAGNTSAVASETATTLCAPNNATGLSITDTNTTAILSWTDPACFDQIIVAVRATTAISGGPASGNDGSSYSTDLNFSTANAADFDASARIVFSGAGGSSPITITNLTAGTVYHFEIFTRKGTEWSSGVSISTATGAPRVVSFNPANGATGVPTNQVFTITFNEDVIISTTGSSDNLIEFDKSGGGDLSVNRNNTGPHGTISISGNVATITLSTDLNIGTAYNILIGNRVFRDASTNHYDQATAFDAWSISTTATGATVTAPTIGTCVGQFSPLGDIVLTEGNDNNFQGTDNGTFTLVLGFDQSGYIFNPSATGVTATFPGGGDIESITLTSITYTQAIFTIDFFDVSNDSQAKDDHDVITISGLKVSRDGSAAPPATVVAKAASTLSIQGLSEDVTSLATINGGSASTAPTVTWPNSNDNSYCIGDDLNAITVTASGGSAYKWYNDAALTSVISALNGVSNPTAAALGFSSAAAGTFTKYVTSSASGCESSSTAVTLVITSLPTADAGNTQTVCPGTPISIGGAPTGTGGSGSYTYSWTSVPAGFTSSAANPAFNAPANATSSNANTTYTVVVTDANNCTDNDNVVITVREVSQPVIFTEPNTFFYTTSNNPVNLKGSPAGGSFSGVGVIQLGNGTYQFDPEVAGVNNEGGNPPNWPVTYTTTLSNGCTKSVTQPFVVSAPYEVFSNLEAQYCNTEGIVDLTISPAMVTQIKAYIDNWNTVYVANYGYAPLKSSASFRGLVRNRYAVAAGAPGYGNGQNNGIIKHPSNFTYTSAGQTLDRYRFIPSAFTTDQAYPSCATCTYAYVEVYLEFADPANTYPYSIASGTDRGYVFNDGTTAAFAYSGEFVYVNPVPVVFFSGLSPDQCKVDTNFELTGNKNGGLFEISSNGSTFADGVNDGILNTTAGKSMFNPDDAYGSGSGDQTRYIRYSVDPGTVGSNGTTGCVGRSTQTVTIHPSSAITFDNSLVDPNNTPYCYEGETKTIVTNRGTGPSTGVLFSGFGISDNANGTASFVPKVAFDQKNPSSTNPESVTITASFTNANGCLSTVTRDYIVYPKPIATYSIIENGNPAANLNFCYNENTISLNGNQPPNSTQQYTIDFIGLGYSQNSGGNVLSFNPATYFDQAVTQGGSNASDAQFTVTYTVTDQISCTASVSNILTVSPLADIIISGVSDGELFCSNVKPFRITFAPVGGSLQVNNVDITNILDANNSISSNVIPIGQNIPIEYEYRSGLSQCLNTSTYMVSNIAAPVAQFSTSPICDRDTVTFTAANNANSYQWTWVLGDSIRSGTDTQSIKHVFPGLSGATQTSYTIRLVIENSPAAPLVCKDSIDAVQVIGAYPEVDFNYANVCQDDYTRFIVSSNIPIASTQWDFGDSYTLPNTPLNANIPAGTHGGRTQGKFGQPEHEFAFTSGIANRYQTRLIARTPPALGACRDTVYHQVAILEKLTPTPAAPYFMSDFYSSEGLWVEEDRSDSSTWIFDVPTGKNVIDNTAGAVWITNATGSHKAKDNSYVNSPCFDLTAFTKPVISFQYWNHSDLNKDGAVLQYSLNGGATWQVLGNLISGLDWYNEQGISSAPGGQNQLGWSGRTQTDWKTGKNSLDGLSAANIRFRIAFSSDERDEYDGFAFNDVKIEERNRFMLIEHFTNALAEQSSAVNLASKTNFNAAAALSTETVRLQYHTSFPGFDAINAQAPADHNARAAYYGIANANVPAGLIDGTLNENLNFLGFGTNWFTNIAQKRALSSSPFEVFVETLAAETNEIRIRAVANNIGAVIGNKPVLHIAVVEKSVAGNNQFVLRKLLPNAAGTSLKAAVADPIPATFEATYTWEVAGVDDPTQLAVVAFIQDEVTKEVHQAHVLMNPDPSTLPSLITGTEDRTLAARVGIYPNPADHEVSIVLPEKAQQAIPVKLIDSFGREVHQSTFERGNTSKLVKTKELAGGIYILQLETAKGIVRKKIMVVHD